MPALNQNATIYRGGSPTIVVTVLDQAGAPVSLVGQTLNWRVSSRAPNATLLVIASPTIMISGAGNNIATIPLTIAQTKALPQGDLYHELYRLDAGVATNYTIGTLTVSPSQMFQHP